MKPSILGSLTLTIALASGIVAYRHASQPPPNLELSYPPPVSMPAASILSKSNPMSRVPPLGLNPDTQQTADASASSAVSLVSVSPLLRRVDHAPAAFQPSATSTLSVAADATVDRSGPSTGGLLARRSQKLPGRIFPRGVTVPLAFQNVDLFLNTAQGLIYAPVNYNSKAGSAQSAGASSHSAPPVPGSPGTIVVNEATAASLEKMRYDFVDAVGGLEQDGNDPAYRRRWLSAQAESDDRFRATYGTQAFLSYQAAAAHKAEAERQAAAQK